MMVTAAFYVRRERRKFFNSYVNAGAVFTELSEALSAEAVDLEDGGAPSDTGDANFAV